MGCHPTGTVFLCFPNFCEFLETSSTWIKTMFVALFFYSHSLNISECMWLKLFQEKNCCNKKLNILKLQKTLFFEGKCHSEEWVTYKHFLEDKITGFPNTFLLIGTKWVTSDGISYSIFSWWGRGRAVYSYFTGILSSFLITTIDLRIVNLFSYLE